MFTSCLNSQVEERLYKLPRRAFLNDSAVFRDIFNLPNSADSAEGTCREHPLKLEGIKKSDFEQLLRVMFPAYA
jgi:hypothetical protein